MQAVEQTMPSVGEPLSVENWEARYLAWLQTPEGRREAGVRRELREQRAGLGAGSADVSAESVKLTYILFRRQWDRLRTGAESQYLPSPRWEQVWPRAAEICRADDLSAEDLVGALFQTFREERYLQPNALLSERVREAARRLSAVDGSQPCAGLSSVRERCHMAFAELYRRTRWLMLFSPRSLTGAEALRFAALEQSQTPYVFPAYCLVAVYGIWDACEALREPAFLKWLANPREYTSVLGGLCPPEWRLSDVLHDKEGVCTIPPPVSLAAGPPALRHRL